MNVFLILVFGIIVLILNIILFFKIWGMTNNIKLLTSIYRHEKGINKEDIFDENGNFRGIGFLDKDGNQIKVQ
tara:strand:- start:96 stop:314 length:219 start_codon:yes stop_codon:yes gene_type:complete